MPGETDLFGLSRGGNSLRSEYWDGWKAVCMIAVIALHAIPAPETFHAGSLKWYADITISQIILFPVPIFLGMAGFFSLGRSSASQLDNPIDYYKGRSMRILPPYLIWTTVSILLEHRSHLSSIRELSEDLLLGTGIGIGYFVIVLIQFILLTPVLAKLNDMRMHIIVMTVLFTFGMLVIYVGRLAYPQSAFARFPFYCLSFIVWYPFYHLGLFAAKFHIVDKGGFRSSTTWMFLLYVLFVAASFAEGIFLCRRGYSLGVSQLKATSLFASLILFLLLLAHQRVPLSPLLKKHYIQSLGRNSYMVYLMHLLVLQGIEAILKKSSLTYSHLLLSALCSFALTSILCVLLAGFVKRLHPLIARPLGA